MSESEDKLHFDLANASYQSSHERQSYLDSRYGAGRFRVDHNSNYDNYAVVHDTQSNRTYHLHRGTVNGDDLKTDLGLAVGDLHNTQRYRHTEARVNDAYQRNPYGEHIHIGHSLGGTLADTFARQHNDKSVAFNMGSSPFADKHPADDKNRHIRIGGDFVSQHQDNTGSGTKTVESNDRNFMNDITDKLKSQFGGPISSYVNGAFGSVQSLYNTYQNHLLSNFKL